MKLNVLESTVRTYEMRYELAQERYDSDPSTRNGARLERAREALWRARSYAEQLEGRVA